MQSLASTSPQLPIAEAWFKATAVGSAPQEQLLQWQDPQGSMDQAPVSATGYSCQVCTHLYASKPHARRAAWTRHLSRPLGTHARYALTFTHPSHMSFTFLATFPFGLCCWQCKETMRSTAVLDLQVAEMMYSCVMLALKLLKAFCPEAGPHQFSQIGLGWPSPAVLKALQVSFIFCTQTCSFYADPLVQLVVLAFIWLS